MGELTILLIPYMIIVGVDAIRIIRRAKSVDLSRKQRQRVVTLILIALVLPLALLLVQTIGRLDVNYLFLTTAIGLWVVISEVLALVLEMASIPCRGFTNGERKAEPGGEASKGSLSE